MTTLSDLMQPAEYVSGAPSVVGHLRQQVPHLVPDGLPFVSHNDLHDRRIAGESHFEACLAAATVLCPILRRTAEDWRARTLSPARVREIGGDGFGFYAYRRVVRFHSYRGATLVVSSSMQARREYRASFPTSVQVLPFVEHEDQVRGHHVLGWVPSWLAAHAASVSMRSGSQNRPEAVVTAQVYELKRISLEEAAADAAAFDLGLSHSYGIGGQA